jgi:predicted metal-dependent HD superfamily phosphohydrolase
MTAILCLLMMFPQKDYQQILQEEYFRILGKNKIAEESWAFLQKEYTSSSRHYHNLKHIFSFYEVIESQKTSASKDDLMLAAFFHDVIYDTHRNDNEEKSAAYAVEILTALKIVPQRIKKIEGGILATKNHQNPSNDPELDYFLDIDLSILGQSSGVYEQYTHQIRAEYGWYSDEDFRQGRAKVLRYFLAKPYIYKTKIMQEKYENQARSNIENELSVLN